MELKKIIYILFFLTISFVLSAQETAIVSGIIKNVDGELIEGANIAVVGVSGGTTSNKNGYFSLTVPANTSIELGITFIGYNSIKKALYLQPNEQYTFNPEVSKSITFIDDVNIEEEKNRSTTMQKINPRLATTFTSSSGSFEAILKTLPGVSSNNELSSQYSVRGGNFDENLVYVNDIEVYRPFLIRSGQQEGLSFINSNMVSDIQFSAGGFDARYGDKMSSVLDVKYKEPEEFAGSVSFSLQGASIHVEGASDNHRFTHLTGIRYKTNQYILQSLDTDGDYKPSFFDIQSYLTYDISEKWEIGFLGNIAKNRYNFIPENRKTEFGTINQALQLSVFFEGQEVDQFQTYFGAISNTYKPKENTELKIITSLFSTLEDEKFDIEGAYSIDELERDLSKDNFGDIKFNRGVGSFLNHARNRLDATVFNIAHKGKIIQNNHTTFWGVKYQHEYIKDKISELGIFDSTDYSIHHSSDSVGYTDPSAQPIQLLELNEVLKSKIAINSNRYSAYLQRTWQWSKDTANYSFNIGIRGSYWDLNDEFIFSPRGAFSFQPNWKKDYLFRLSGGVYYQPPFYKEMRGFNGEINKNIKSQVSYQAVLAADRNFEAWERPFKFTTAIYYKYMQNIIPYEIDNVRIRYFATNNANAYATGVDFKVNGEFVKGVESWFSMSIMKSEENLVDDYYVEYINSDGETIIPGYTSNNTAIDSNTIQPGNIPRPTDQRVNFSLYFQDYVPKLPSLKMHIALYYGTGLPFGPSQNHERYKATLRIPPYRRVDLGFSYLLKSDKKEVKGKNPLNYFKNIWVSAEVFNLLQINNVISYLWVEDITGRNYAVPNYLTSRQFNLKFYLEF
ncbi:MAG: carboxypeptidase-like regulatory domain-containing protein [Vicingus serpentipes]|nr:carboxypeptidase-like regulatory domain-containing protein [Vicingus serpentipes]